jgi:hypothetical protein
VSLFDGQSIDAAVTKALVAADAPADHTKAFLLTGTTGPGGGLNVAYVQRLAQGWSVEAEAEIAFDGKVSARGGVLWTGK